MDQKYNYVYSMFYQIGMIDWLNIDKQTFQNFLVQIGNKYEHRNNPFHNFDHGITVSHGIYYMIKENITSDFLEKIEEYILIFSALCHDVDHSGFTNAFETNRKTQLFQKYGNQSPLERNHIEITFRILQQNDCNLFVNLDKKTIKKIKKFTTENILVTDMSKHFALTNLIKENLQYYLTNKKKLPESDRIDISGILIHTADIGAPARIFKIAHDWSVKISKEFANQVEQEKKLNLPVTPFYVGLEKYINIAKNEIGFLKNFILPIWVQVKGLAGGKLDQVETNILNNADQWQQIYDRELQKEQKEQQQNQTQK